MRTGGSSNLFGRRLIETAALVATAVFPAISGLGAPVVWDGGGDGSNWSDPLNWNPDGVPSNGDDVTVNGSHSIQITNSTADLVSLTVNGSTTVTCSNWTTKITATILAINAGSVTLPGPFTESQTSNRVWLECSNLYVAAGASITADGKGYSAGGTRENGHGPGGGIGYSNYSSGGGHGGRGGHCHIISTEGGPRYGSLTAPVAPGSGGGNWNGVATGHGGGAVRIEASGTVTVNGTVTANGGAGGDIIAGGGSGGSIFVSCLAFAGTNGTIQAKGGNAGRTNYGGGGGGGRIAVTYNLSVQATLPRPDVLFLANRGAGHTTYPNPQNADIGTLYFSDYSCLGPELVRHVGLWQVAGSSSLSVDTLTVSNGWLRLPTEGFVLTVTNDVLVTGSSSILDMGGYGYVSNAVSDGSRFNTGATSGPTLHCGGDLIITNNGSLLVYSGMTNAGPPDYGALVSVTGDICIASGTKVYPYSHGFNGGSVLFLCAKFTVADGAAIDADGTGYLPGLPFDSARQYRGYGPGGGVNVAGGGYGGRGGDYTIRPGGLPYGDPAVPLGPGSGGGGQWGVFAGYAGGSVRVEATGAVTVDGTITADGRYSLSGAGAGGAVYVVCGTFHGTNGVIDAKGASANNCAGGGGRIAIVYTNAEAQAAIAVPRVTFSVAKGPNNPHGGPWDMGTIYFPDTAMLDSEWLPHTGRFIIPGFTNWAVGGLHLSNSWVRFPSDAFHLMVSNDLVIEGTSAKLELGGDCAMTKVGGGMNQFIFTGSAGPTLNVRHDLVLTNGGTLTVYAGITNDPSEYGALVSVGHTIDVGANCWIYPHSQPTNGGSVMFRTGNLLVGVGGGVNADARGFFRGEPGHVRGWGPGGAGADGGGGYGGKGGDYAVGSGGPTYGSSNAPVEPGSGGGGEPTVLARNGGGLIRVEASRTLSVKGMLTARGETRNGWGPGSGGGIYIQCKEFTGDSGGVIRADGGTGGYTAGGGGRIAIWRRTDTSGGSISVSVDGDYGSYGSSEDGTTTWHIIPAPGTRLLLL